MAKPRKARKVEPRGDLAPRNPFANAYITRPRSFGEALFNLGISFLQLEIRRRQQYSAVNTVRRLQPKPIVVDKNTEYYSPEELRRLKDKLNNG